MIAERATLAPHAERRIASLIAGLRRARLSKYNVGAKHRDGLALPDGEKILVAGQVENDASIKFGAGRIATNQALIEAARAAHPDAILIYKPHPDVEAGLRRGKVKNVDRIADVVAHDMDPIDLIEACDRVWTMTSLIGFEALLRDTPVTCTGAPFYAGWGVTTDLGRVPARRAARVSVHGLAHATLIDYPRYFDPQSGASLSPEQAAAALQTAPNGRSRAVQSALAKLRQMRAKYIGLDG